MQSQTLVISKDLINTPRKMANGCRCSKLSVPNWSPRMANSATAAAGFHKDSHMKSMTNGPRCDVRTPSCLQQSPVPAQRCTHASKGSDPSDWSQPGDSKTLGTFYILQSPHYVQKCSNHIKLLGCF